MSIATAIESLAARVANEIKALRGQISRPREVVLYFDNANWTWPSRPALDEDQFIVWDAFRTVWTQAYPVPRPPLLNGDRYVPSLTDPIRGRVIDPVLDFYSGDYLWLDGDFVPVVENVAPTADFSFNASLLQVSFNASSSTDIDDGIASYDWLFGDGTTGAGVTTQHTYAATGSYTVVLTVTDGHGSTATKSTVVAVDATAPLFTDTFDGTGNLAGSTSTTGGQVWQQRLTTTGVFSTTTNNATKSGGTTGARVNTNPGVDVWFSTITSFPHISLEVTLAALGADAATRHGGLGVRIGANGTGIFLSLRQNATANGYSIRKYNSGGSISTLATTTRIPLATDRLRIDAQGDVITAYINGSQVMQVTDPLNNQSGEVGLLFGAQTAGFAMRWDNILAKELVAPVVEIPNTPPAAAFTTTATNLHVVADASSSPDPDGVIVSYVWDWADGTTSSITTPIAEHDYAAAGTYQINLTVTDDDDDSSTVAHSVTVVAPPVLIAADTFNRSGNLAGSTTTTGSKVWRQRLASSGSESLTANNVITFNTDIIGTRGGGSPGAPIWDTITVDTVDADVRSVLISAGTTAATRGGGLGVRVAPTGVGIFLEARQSSSVDGYSLRRVNAGGGTTLLASTTRVPVAGDLLRLTAQGETVTAYVNGEQIMQITDTTSPVTATEAGYYFTAGTSGYEQRWNDFSVYQLASAPVTPALVAPTVTAAPGGSGEISVDWNDVAGATSYQVRLDGVLVGSPTVSNITLSGLVNGQTYTILVRSVNAAGTESSDSTAVTQAPAAATALGQMAGYALDVSADSLALGTLTTATDTVRGLAFTQATALRRPTVETVDGRKAITFGATQITNPDGTTTSSTSYLVSGASDVTKGKTGATLYALVWVPDRTYNARAIATLNRSTDQRLAARLVHRRPTIAGKRLDSGGGTLWLQSPGVSDLSGSWKFVGYHQAPTGQVRITVNGVLEHTSDLHTAGPFSNTALTSISLGGEATGGDSFDGSLSRFIVFEGIDAGAAHAQQVMTAIGFTPPVAAAPTFTYTVGEDLGVHYQTGAPVIRDEYRALLTFSASATYEVRSSMNLRQVWKFVGTKFRVPFMNPGQHTFEARSLDTTTNKWSAWKVHNAVYTARAWPTPVGDELMWKMPNAWGKTYPITTVNLVAGQQTLTLNANGHYLIKTPPGVRFETNRFDLTIGTTPTDEVLWKIEGGEFHSAPDARINLKLGSGNAVAWIYGQLEGVAFTGGNNGDTVQMSFNGTRDATLVTQNCSGAQITWGRVEHSDTHQLYAGPNTWKCDRWDAASDYQGFILYPQQINSFLEDNGGYITSWPMHRTRVHIATRLNKEGTSHTAGIPYYSWHDRLTGAPWPVYDKTAGNIEGLFTTQDTDEQAPATYAQTLDVNGNPVAGSLPIGTKIAKTPGSNIGCWWIDRNTYSLSDGNISPGPWDGVQRIAKGGALPGTINLTGTGRVPGIGFNVASVIYAPTPGAITGRATLASVGPTLPESGMTVVNGDLTITTDGFRLYNTLVNGFITVKANNVTIEECIQRAPATSSTVKFGIKASDVNATTLVPFTGLLVKNTSLEVPVGNRSVYHGTGIAGGNYTLQNIHISGYVDGMGVFGTSQGYRRYLVADRVYIHDMPFYAVDPAQTDGSHNDGAQDQGRSRVSITRSVILGGRTSAILIQQNIANVGSETNHESVLIEDNYLDLEYDGGAVINISESGKGVIANLTIQNNEFGNSFPTKPRIILPNTTKNASTTIIANNKYTNGTAVTTSVGA